MKNIGNEIIEGLEEALFLVAKRGRKSKTLSKDNVSVKPVDSYSSVKIKNFRTRLGMSTSVFAKLIGATPKTVQSWESGTRVPGKTVQRFLNVLEKHPGIAKDYIVKK